MKNKKGVRYMLIAGGIGFALALIVMAIDIFLGYTKAYSSNVSTMNVTLLFLPIYVLKQVDGKYIGSTLSQNMGIISIIFIAAGIAVERLLIKIEIK